MKQYIGTKPVSYTHLDVYKRQPSTLSKTQEARFNRFWAIYPRKVAVYCPLAGLLSDGAARAVAEHDVGPLVCLLYTSRLPGGP